MMLQESPIDVKEKINELLKDINKNKKIVICSPATTWDNKHWDETQWAELLKYLHEKVNIVFTGMDTDQKLINRILNLAQIPVKDVTILAGMTNLEELAEVFKRSDLVISPDSGSAHVAWATSKPAIITIFTATAEKRNAPYGDNCFVITPKIDCRPCMTKNCKRKQEKNICCKLVKANEVITLAQNILQL